MSHACCVHTQHPRSVCAANYWSGVQLIIYTSQETSTLTGRSLLCYTIHGHHGQMVGGSKLCRDLQMGHCSRAMFSGTLAVAMQPLCAIVRLCEATCVASAGALPFNAPAQLPPVVLLVTTPGAWQSGGPIHVARQLPLSPASALTFHSTQHCLPGVAAAAASLPCVTAAPGLWLFGGCRGIDASPVVASGPPKTISVEDSFKRCSSWAQISTVLQVSCHTNTHLFLVCCCR
jgi:hypothetical protein